MAAKAKKAAKAADAQRSEPITKEEFERLRQEMAATVLERIKRQRRRLIMVEEFFGNLALRLTLKEDFSCKTMWVDGVYLGYNPEFAIGLSDAEIKGVLAHEVLHVACGHCWRRAWREPKLWNEACDYAINHIVFEAGFVLPQGALYEKALAGKSAETIYDILKKRQAGKPQASQPNPQSSGQGQEDKPSDGKPEDAKQSQKEGPPQEAGKNPEGEEKSERASKAASDEDAAPSEGPTKASEPQGSQEGSAQADSAEAGSSESSGESAAKGSSASSTQGDPQTGTPSQGEVPGSGQPRAYEPGEVRTPSAETRIEEVQAEWEIAIKQARSMARRRGTMPGRWAELLDEASLPNIDWRQVLRMFMQQVWSPFDFTFRRPNARFIGTGFYLPTYHNESIPCVVGAWDTSGSVWSRLLTMFQAEFGSILEELKPQEAWLMQGDTRVNEQKHFVSGDDISFGPILGRGGTDFRPFFQRIEDEGWSPTCLLFFTDLEGPFPDREPDYPVLWVTPPTQLVPPWGMHVQMYD